MAWKLFDVVGFISVLSNIRRHRHGHTCIGVSHNLWKATLAFPLQEQKLLSISSRYGKWFALVIIAQLLGGCGAMSSYADKSRNEQFVTSPFYTWMKLDDHRSLQKALIVDGNHSDAEWIFLDTQERTSFLFPREAELLYTTYQTDDKKTIVFIGREYPSHTCKAHDFGGDACPDINLFISRDGGRSFMHQHVILPDLNYSTGGAGAGDNSGAEVHPIPLVMVRQHVLYLVLGGYAEPRVRRDGNGDYRVVSTGEVLSSTDKRGVAYTWPDQDLALWELGAQEAPPLRPQEAFVFAIELPDPRSLPAGQASQQGLPGRGELMCGWLHMQAASQQWPVLHATQVLGRKLEPFKNLPAYQMPRLPPFGTQVLYSASENKKQRAQLLQSLQSSFPDWVAAQSMDAIPVVCPGQPRQP